MNMGPKSCLEQPWLMLQGSWVVAPVPLKLETHCHGLSAVSLKPDTRRKHHRRDMQLRDEARTVIYRGLNHYLYYFGGSFYIF